MGNTAVYVKVDEYKDALEVLELIKTKINDAKTTLNKINALKHKEDAELEQWNNSLADAEEKISFIDKSLFEPGSM